jgi:anti-sigma factor RsiW
MPLSSTVLAASIKAKRLAALGDAVADGPELDADCQAIAEAVVEHIVAAALVTIPAGVAVQVAVPAGTGATIAPGIGTVT